MLYCVPGLAFGMTCELALAVRSCNETVVGASAVGVDVDAGLSWGSGLRWDVALVS